jgi:hypothetical protein
MVVSKRVVRRPRPADDEAPVTRTPIVEDDEEEEEEAPRPTKKAPVTTGKPNVRSGWTGSEQVIDSTSSFAQAFKLDESAQVIAFLDDKPYAGYARHWIERSGTDKSGKKGKTNRPYTCLTSVGMGECPVCDVGDKPQAVSSFNVALIGDDGVPTLKSWDAGAKLFRLFKQYNNDPKVGPLTKGFYLVSRSGTGGSTNYQVNPVRRTSLLEDYNIEPPTADQLLELGRYDADIVSIPTRKEMNEIAAELSDYDEYDD